MTRRVFHQCVCVFLLRFYVVVVGFYREPCVSTMSWIFCCVYSIHVYVSRSYQHCAEIVSLWCRLTLPQILQKLSLKTTCNSVSTLSDVTKSVGRPTCIKLCIVFAHSTCMQMYVHCIEWYAGTIFE